jgi:hypothetical protein
LSNIFAPQTGKFAVSDGCVPDRNEFQPLTLTDENAREWFDAVAQVARSQSCKEFSGRGITICGGGKKYLPCVWVAINMLRRVGCALPIELWHLGRSELPEEFEEMLRPLGVACVDALAAREIFPCRILRGWELKPYAILRSRFAEVIALDADNITVRDPTYLFDCPEYAKTGVIFWPDFERLKPARSIWQLTGVAYRDEPEFETGQVVIDKRKCLAPLYLTLKMNEYSDFWYHYIHGDKETFHMAWRKLDQPYSMPARGIDALAGTMCQHDFDGQRLFQHRNMLKWTLYENPRVIGFLFESECIDFINSARSKLADLLGLPEPTQGDAGDLAGRLCEYERVGYDNRQMFLGGDGKIGSGAGGMEKSWSVVIEDGIRVLKIYGDLGLTVRLHQDSQASRVWRGQWRMFEQMPIVIRVL